MQYIRADSRRRFAPAVEALAQAALAGRRTDFQAEPDPALPDALNGGNDFPATLVQELM